MHVLLHADGGTTKHRNPAGVLLPPGVTLTCSGEVSRSWQSRRRGVLAGVLFHADGGEADHQDPGDPHADPAQAGDGVLRQDREQQREPGCKAGSGHRLD